MFEDIPDCPKCGNNFAKHDGKICDVRTCWDEEEVQTLKESTWKYVTFLDKFL